MNRLNFTLPDFTRVSWVSVEARSAWSQKLQKVSSYILEMEKISCLKGRVALLTLNGGDLPGLTRWASEHRLMVVCLQPQGSSDSYASTVRVYQPGSPWLIRVALGEGHLVQEFHQAWLDEDNREIGRRLGYPLCCRDFFEEFWVRQHFLDTTWPMCGEIGEKTSYVKGFDECNILLRWIGVRAVPYLPCSFTCENTVKFTNRFLDKTKIEYGWLMEMLSWPVEWSALHGIAEIKTPILRISTRTDATGERYTVRRVGMNYPIEGASGLRFPYRTVQSLNAKLWENNGFASKAAMDEGHDTIMQVALQISPMVKSIHDLGCGNGLLLKRLSSGLATDVMLVGVDTDRVKLQAARNLCPDGVFIRSDIISYHGGEAAKPSVALISVNRFSDCRERLDKVLEHFDYILIYSYNGKSLDPVGWERVVKLDRGINKASLFRRRQ